MCCCGVRVCLCVLDVGVYIMHCLLYVYPLFYNSLIAYVVMCVVVYFFLIVSIVCIWCLRRVFCLCVYLGVCGVYGCRCVLYVLYVLCVVCNCC